MQTLFALQAATLAARARLADKHISTRAESGKVQVVRAVPRESGLFDITPLSGWLGASDAVDFLKAM